MIWKFGALPPPDPLCKGLIKDVDKVILLKGKMHLSLSRYRPVTSSTNPVNHNILTKPSVYSGSISTTSTQLMHHPLSYHTMEYIFTITSLQHLYLESKA